MKIDGLLQYMAMKLKPDVPAIHCVAINTEAKSGITKKYCSVDQAIKLAYCSGKNRLKIEREKEKEYRWSICFGRFILRIVYSHCSEPHKPLVLFFSI